MNSPLCFVIVSNPFAERCISDELYYEDAMVSRAVCRGGTIDLTAKHGAPVQEARYPGAEIGLTQISLKFDWDPSAYNRLYTSLKLLNGT